VAVELERGLNAIVPQALAHWHLGVADSNAVFAGSRRFGEEWAYRFLGAAVADRSEST